MIFKKSSILIVLLLCIVHFIQAQKFHKPHHAQSELYDDVQAKTESEWDEAFGFSSLYEKSHFEADTLNLNKTVFGWHPYWMGTAYEDYNYQLLSDIAYFSYEVNPNTGSYNDIHFWKSTHLIDLAHQAGTRVSLAVTLFNGHKTFLENSAARQTLIDSLASLLDYRSATGVNIDFEGIPSTQKENFTDFMVQLSEQLRKRMAEVFISVAIPAVDWSGIFDGEELYEAADLFIIMGYDYYWSSSPVAGPVAPKTSGQIWGPWNATRSVLDYLEAGIPSKKLCLGVPYYGYNWKVLNSGKGAATISRGDAIIFTNAKSNARTYGRQWDNHASVPYYEYYENGVIAQTWYDDEVSLGFKYDLIGIFDIAGIGIWALGYDRNTNDLWNLLKNKFSSNSDPLIDGHLSDLGGPEGDYYAGVSWDYEIPASDSLMIRLLQRNMDLSQGDTLKIFSSDSLIQMFTMNSGSVGVINAFTPLQITFIANSDEAAAGWEINWFVNDGDSTAFHLSGDTIEENLPGGSKIGNFLNNCEGSGEFNYMIVKDDGMYDSEFFFANMDALYSSKSFNYEKDSAYFIRVKQQDQSGNIVFRNFLINVADANDTPIILQTPLEVMQLNRNEPFDFCLPDLFFDEDASDTLVIQSFVAENGNLPEWLNFNSTSVCFSGVSPDTAFIDVIIQATDRLGKSVQTGFNLRVGNFTDFGFTKINEMDIYPNPFKEKLVINIDNDWPKEELQLFVFDVSGKVIFSKRLLPEQNVLEISTSGFKPGMYVLQLKLTTSTVLWQAKVLKRE